MSDILALEGFLPYRLNSLADAVSRDFAAIYRKKYGLTRPEWRLLATLGQYRSMTATQIARHSAMHKTKVSRAVTVLEKRRWVVRETDENDRRIEHLRLTKAGEDAYREMVPLAKAFEASLLRQIGPDDRRAMLKGLAALEQAMARAIGEGCPPR